MSREKVNTLISIVKEYSRVAVVSHDNPDPDSIASAFGLHLLLEKRTRTKVDVCFSGIVGRVGNRVMLKTSGIRYHWLDRIDLSQYDGVIIVDSQPGAGNNSIPPSIIPVAVLDHHPPRPELQRVRYVDVRADLGATSTIVTEYLLQARVKIDPKLATSLLYGIKSETLDLSRRTTPADIQAYLRLFHLVDFNLLAKIQNPKLPRMYYEQLRRAMERAYVYDGVVISDVGQDARPEMVAEAADLLLRLEDVTWSVCYGEYDGDLFVSVRTDVSTANAGELVREVVDGLGSAGGHDTLAAATIHGAPQSVQELDQMKSYLTKRFLLRLGAGEKPISKLLEWKKRKSETQAA